jgi:glycosyltransferase involved in cell wall biosynthesis
MCGIWQFGQKAFDEGKIKIFKSVIDADKNAFDPQLREKTRKEYGIENNIVIGHIGRLTAQKNTLFVIDIFNEVVKKEPKAKLIVIGYGELEKPMLQKIKDFGIEDQVIYLGRTEDIRKFYNAFDCFLLPSLYEGVPVVGIESECCGLPIFFSTEISRESSPCDDLGHFIGLNESPEKWAQIVISETKKNMIIRSDRSAEIIGAGFDSSHQAHDLLEYYERSIAHITDR